MEVISEGSCSNIFAELKVLNASKGFNCTTNELLTAQDNSLSCNHLSTIHTFNFLKDPVEI